MGSGRSVPPSQEGSQAPDRLAAGQARERLTPGTEPESGYPHARRLARAADIRQVLQTGRRRRSHHLDLIWAENTAGHPRMGLIVPRYRSTAVARNRLRRRLREIWRREVQQRQPDVDLLIRTRREAYQATHAVLRAELLAWRDRIAPEG